MHDWMFDQFKDLEFWIFNICSEIFNKDDRETSCKNPTHYCTLKIFLLTSHIGSYNAHQSWSYHGTP